MSEIPMVQEGQQVAEAVDIDVPPPQYQDVHRRRQLSYVQRFNVCINATSLPRLVLAIISAVLLLILFFKLSSASTGPESSTQIIDAIKALSSVYQLIPISSDNSKGESTKNLEVRQQQKVNRRNNSKGWSTNIVQVRQRQLANRHNNTAVG